MDGLRRAAGATSFEGREPDITEENLQARIRGNLLMALSNKFGWLVLTTGNKSEMSVGYSTLYGDTRRRLRGHQGRARRRSSTGSCDYRNARDGRAAGARSRSSTAPPSRRAAPRPARRRTRCRPTTMLDAILEAYVEEDLGREQLDRARPARGGRRPRHPRSSTAPSTSAARRRRASRSRRRRSGATGGCRSPTATAADRARHRRREPARDRRRVRARAGRARGDGRLHGACPASRRPTTCPARLHDRPRPRPSRPSG